MHIHTMAVQITDKTWPVAVACLGASFASRPLPEVEGTFLIINTPDHHGFRRVRPHYDSDRGSNLTLGNTWETEEDFLKMYQFDGRKNLGTFFEVTKVADRPPFKPAKADLRHQLHLLADQLDDEEPETDD